MVRKMKAGEGKVVLISGGGKTYTDIAARFCKSEKDLDSILASSYDKELVRRILNSGHLAATEFDYYIFGVEGYSRVTETQLVRKRLASYLIKSGRADKKGKRSYDVVLPESIINAGDRHFGSVVIDSEKIDIQGESLDRGPVEVKMNYEDILTLLQSWYNEGIELGLPEEDLRYMKPQATEFKAIIGMNAHALLDWFKIRCCKNAQWEIRDLATKMMTLCKEVSPDVFENAGPSCVSFGYCPENQGQNPECSKITKDKALRVLERFGGEDV